MKSLAIFILLAACFSSIGADGDAQTLDEAIEAAIENNPRIKKAEANLRATREQVPQARAAYRPQITLRGSASATDRDARLQDGQDFSEAANPLSASLQIRQNIYSGGLRAATTRRAALNMRAERFRFQDEEIRLALEVGDAYFGARLADDRLIVQTDISRLIFDQIEAAEERYRLGIGTITDVSQIKGRHAGATASLSVARAELIRSRTLLEFVTGIPISDGLEGVPHSTLPTTMEEAVLLAVQHAPALKSANARFDSSRMDILAASRQNRPQVDITLEASTSREGSPAIERDDDLRATLSVTVPLFDGGAAKSRRRQAGAARTASLYQLREIEQQVELSVIDAWLRHDAATAEIASQIERVAVSELALEGINQGLNAGLWSTTDILDATEQLALAKLGLIEAQNRQDIAAFELSMLCGTSELFR